MDIRLTELRASRYRSLRDVKVELGRLNVFVGANASGKSNILDALRLLHQAVSEKTFVNAVRQRGGMLHLAWKGEAADEVELSITCQTAESRFEWTVNLVRDRYDFTTKEQIYELVPGVGRVHRLECDDGRGWWSSAEKDRVPLSLPSTDCALVAAAADGTFPARVVADFVRGWGFFDPNPWVLRRAADEFSDLGTHGENLAARLKWLKEGDPDAYRRVLNATRAVLGVPDELSFRENEGRVYFTQREPGLQYEVHQIGASSGTLRMLALMTALHGSNGAPAGLIGIEEPDNYVHPAAVAAFAEHLVQASASVQLAITTHSPLILDCIGDPEVLRVVTRHGDQGTRIEKQQDPGAVRRALAESGFGLGQWLETSGFGA